MKGILVPLEGFGYTAQTIIVHFFTLSSKMGALEFSRLTGIGEKEIVKFGEDF